MPKSANKKTVTVAQATGSATVATTRIVASSPGLATSVRGSIVVNQAVVATTNQGPVLLQVVTYWLLLYMIMLEFLTPR